MRAGYLDLDGCTVVDMLPRQVLDVENMRLIMTDNLLVLSFQRAQSAPRLIQLQASLEFAEIRYWQFVENAIAK